MIVKRHNFVATARYFGPDWCRLVASAEVFMRIFLAASFALLALGGAAFAQSSTDPKQAPSGAYSLETRHSQVLFAIPHLGITDYYGRFDKLSGSLNWNAGAADKSFVSLVVDMTSIDTPRKELVGELIGKGVFDATTFPSASFKSTAVTK